MVGQEAPFPGVSRRGWAPGVPVLGVVSLWDVGTRQFVLSTCASAASASGSQNVISIARYISMALVSAASGLLRLASRGIQQAEAAMTMGLEGTHVQLLGQAEGLAVVGFGLFGLWGMAMRRDLAEEPQDPCLVAVLLEV